MKQLCTIIFVLFFAFTVKAQKLVESFDVSPELSGYDIVDFKSNDSSGITRSQDTINVSQGEAALRLQYKIRSLEEWGSSVTLAMQIPHGRHYWDFSGYESISFNIYNEVKSSEAERAYMQFVLYDKSEFGLYENKKEFWWSFLWPLDLEPGWNTITIPLKDVGSTAQSEPGSGFWLTGSAGHLGNETLDLDKISGVGFSIKLSGPADNSNISGTFLLDNLILTGEKAPANGQYTLENFDQPFEVNGYDITHFGSNDNSNVTRSQDNLNANEGIAALNLEYSVKAEATWGGSAGVAFERSSDFWDFSGYDSIRFNIYNKVKSSTAGRSHLRLVLYEKSEFDITSNKKELWLSFLWHLDLEPGWNTITLPLKDVGQTAQSQPGSGFWLPGWTGQLGNETLNLDKISGVGFEIVADGPADNNDITGTFLVDNLVLKVGNATTDIISKEAVPNAFSLEQNYPNPFNPSTEINFKITNQSKVKLSVFNSLGKEIMTLVNQDLQPGTYNAVFDAGNLSSGTYFYQLRAGNLIQTKKMLLIK